MSDLLFIEPGRVVSLGASPLDVHNYLKTDITKAGWQLISEDTTTVPTKLYFIPPAYEPIGNEQCREVVMMEIGSDYIGLRPINEALKPYPQSCWFASLKDDETPSCKGMNAAACTVNGVSVSQPPESLAQNNTEAENLRFLFEALCASKDASIKEWEWLFYAPGMQNADDKNHYILGIRKTAAPDVEIKGVGIRGGTLGRYSATGLEKVNSEAPFKVNIDLVYGFIYFLQINKRGIAMATRTNTAYYGPLHACYGDHEQAIKAMPDAGKWSKFVSPIELLVGEDGKSNSALSTAHPAKSIAISPYLAWNKINNKIHSSSHPFSFFHLINQFFDCTWSIKSREIFLNPSCAFPNEQHASYADEFQIHRMSMLGNYSWSISVNDSGPRAAIGNVPAIKIDDWYKFIGTATDENLQFCAESEPCSTLKGEMNRAGEYSEITLESTKGMPQKGFVVLENEAIEYSGISGNKLMGCVRAKYATKKTHHFDGCPAYQGLWFIKINGGALFAGYVKP